MTEIYSDMPEPEDYVSLVSEAGWSQPTLPMAKAALRASFCGIVAKHDGKTIGMARAIGDGVMNVYIQDVIVSRAYRRQGIGRKLMLGIIRDLKTKCPASCMIGLFAAEGRSGFYASFGFNSRPDIGFGPGMHATLSALAKTDGAA